MFGVRHELTLSALYAGALARHDLGDNFGASADANVTYAYRERLLGEHHPDTLSARLARVTWLGEAVGATSHTLNNLDELISVMQTGLGHDHPNTLVARYTRAAWTPASANDVERISEWEVLAEDLARVHGEQHPLTVAGREKLDEARAEWADTLNETRGIAFNLLVDMESENLGLDLSPERSWDDTGNLDDDAVERVADRADEERSEHAELMDNVVAAKKALSQSARTLGNDAYQTLLWRYYLAWWFWNGHEFAPGGRRTKRLIDDCVRLLGEEHPLTAASRDLLYYIDTQTWRGCPLFWDGSALVS